MVPPAGQTWPYILERCRQYGEITAFQDGITGAARLLYCHHCNTFLGVGVSYRSLLEQVEELGRGLVGAGLRPGDVICLALPNCVQYPLVVLAGAAAQCVVRSVRCLVSSVRLLDMTPDS